MPVHSRVMISLQYLNGVIGGAVIAHHEFQFHIWIFLELLIQDGIHLLTDIFATINMWPYIQKLMSDLQDYLLSCS